MPLFSPLLVDVESPDLTTDEQIQARRLGERLLRTRGFLGVLDAYYNGEQRIEDLGISTPPVMKHLRTVTGWPRLLVDALDERLDVEGFRYPQSVTADVDLWAIWQANNLDEESQLAHMDALIFGRAFVMVGSNPEAGSPPLVTIESPMNMAAEWDARTRAVTGALQVYQMDGQEAATLLLENVTVNLSRKQGEAWRVDSRDEHNLNACPVVMVTNRTRSNDRYGRSEITPEVRSITDAACRTLLGLEAAREFYATPQRWALNVGQENFKNTDGTDADSWQSVMSKVWAIPPSEDLNAPEPKVGQFTAMSPVVYTEIVDMYATIMASMTGLPPHFLGKTTDNPASADAIRSAESRLNKRAERRMRAFSGSWEHVVRLALTIANGGKMPTDSKQIETIWAEAATPTPVASSTAIQQQVSAGILPPTSDVALERLGYTPLERERIRIDRERDAGDAILAQLAHADLTKESRADNTVAADIAGDGFVTPTPAKAVPPVKAAPAKAPPAPPKK